MDNMREAIRAILERDWVASIQHPLLSFRFEFDILHTTYVTTPAGKALKHYSRHERSVLIEEFCDRLFHAAGDRSDCTESLDEIFSERFNCQWWPETPSISQLTDEVEKILRRMPELPTELPGLPDGLSSDYFNHPGESWASLKVVSHLQRNLVRFTAYQVLNLTKTGIEPVSVSDSLTHVGELIQQCVSSSKSSKKRADQPVWYVVRAFLWSFWQKVRTVHMYFRIVRYLRWGYNHSDEKKLLLRNFIVDPNMSLRAWTEKAANEQKPANLCSWGFRLLRGNPFCLGLDFKILCRRFQDVFGHMPARCQEKSQTVCNGYDWHNCLRYYRTDTPDQSMHDTSQSHETYNEVKVAWDEMSYRNVKGARAVSISCKDGGCLKYCAASNRTLAFSHVWSHGQGGRPESGINKCLHHRYIELARSMGCDSYWIDSACMWVMIGIFLCSDQFTRDFEVSVLYRRPS